MNILKKLFSPSVPQSRFYDFFVRCKRCGEIVAGQVNLSNDPSLEFDENDKPYYVCRKVLIGSGHCFQSIEAHFKFDENRRLLERQVTGGEFVDK